MALTSQKGSNNAFRRWFKAFSQLIPAVAAVGAVGPWRVRLLGAMLSRRLVRSFQMTKPGGPRQDQNRKQNGPPKRLCFPCKAGFGSNGCERQAASCSLEG